MSDIYDGPRVKDFRVWWVPQLPMEPFVVDCDTLKEAYLVSNTLAFYDLFQYEHHVKPDYSNAGGVLRWLDDEGVYEDMDDWEVEEALGIVGEEVYPFPPRPSDSDPVCGNPGCGVRHSLHDAPHEFVGEEVHS